MEQHSHSQLVSCSTGPQILYLSSSSVTPVTQDHFYSINATHTVSYYTMQYNATTYNRGNMVKRAAVLQTPHLQSWFVLIWFPRFCDFQILIQCSAPRTARPRAFYPQSFELLESQSFLTRDKYSKWIIKRISFKMRLRGRVCRPMCPMKCPIE